MASFFHELKQRRIVQIMVSYAVSGWVALEVVGALVERSIVPEVLYRVGLVVYLGGLVVAAITGWFHGEKGHQRAPRMEKVLVTLTVVVTLALAARTGLRFQAQQIAAQAGVEGALDLDRVAVMYFRDLSRDGELAYLADGITEGLIEQLEGVGVLDVLSAQGADQYRDTDLPRDSLARIFGAGTLVEGSVEPRGDQIRVTVALYDGEGGAEINRQTLERDADDPLALQAGVADEVGELLRTWLDTSLTLRETREGTDVAAAWTEYQRAERAFRDAADRFGAGDVQGFVVGAQRADSLYAVAEELDPDWAAPSVGRAIFASRWGALSAPEDPVEGRAYLELAREHAEEALRKDPRSAWGHYVRGGIAYIGWQVGLHGTEDERAAAFTRARADLEESVSLDPELAIAWRLLSELYSQIPDQVQANIAAQRALDADAFLRQADDVVYTLYATSYDLEQFGRAIQYCEQGAARFPSDPRFVQCRLWLMAAPRALEPDPDRGWALVEEHVDLLPETARREMRVEDEMIMGQILARAGLADSARAVVDRARPGPELDPTRQILGLEALVHLALGDQETALDRLRTYLTASPEHRAGWRWSAHWWWRPLQDNGEFRRLVGG